MDGCGAGIEVEAYGDADWVVGDAVVIEEIFCGEVSGGHGAELGADALLGVVEELIDEGGE